jgi:hypothetical protein
VKTDIQTKTWTGEPGVTGSISAGARTARTDVETRRTRREACTTPRGIDHLVPYKDARIGLRQDDLEIAIALPGAIEVKTGRVIGSEPGNRLVTNRHVDADARRSHPRPARTPWVRIETSIRNSNRAIREIVVEK